MLYEYEMEEIEKESEYIMSCLERHGGGICGSGLYL